MPFYYVFMYGNNFKEISGESFTRWHGNERAQGHKQVAVNVKVYSLHLLLPFMPAHALAPDWSHYCPSISWLYGTHCHIKDTHHPLSSTCKNNVLISPPPLSASGDKGCKWVWRAQVCASINHPVSSLHPPKSPGGWACKNNGLVYHHLWAQGYEWVHADV